MEFNYGREKKKFEREQERLEKEYRQAGMNEEAIQKMYEFDYEQFKKQRTFCRHNQFIEQTKTDEENSTDGFNTLMYRFMNEFSVEISMSETGRYGWIEEIKDVSLYECLSSMNENDLEIVTMLFAEGFTVVEIAELKKVSHQAISKKWNRIQKNIKKFMVGVAD